MSDRILDFEDLKERYEAERLANERCHQEVAKLISKKKSKLNHIIIKNTERINDGR